MSSLIKSANTILSMDKINAINAYLIQNRLVISAGTAPHWYTAPVSLLPNLYPRSAFEYVVKIQPIWNKLIDRISRDKSFLCRELEDVSKSDEEFTGRLLRIYQDIPEDVLKHHIQMGMSRSDYMLDNLNGNKPLQVEINTISSGLMCLSQRLVEFQKLLLKR